MQRFLPRGGAALSRIRGSGSHGIRTKSTRTYDRASLREPLQGFEQTASNESRKGLQLFDTKMSKLENGIRVASEEHFGEFCTIGVAIESGARYEASYTKGTSHFLEKLAFSSSLKHQSREDIYGVLEKSSALVDCQSTKDTFIYAASCHRDGLDSVMEIISNSVWRPLLSDEEMEEARLVLQFENMDMRKKIECEPLLTDWLHTAAFRGNTVGFSKFVPDENVMKVTKEEVFSYMSQYHAPQRIVIAGVGVPHDELLSVSRKYFDERTSTWALKPDVLPSKFPELDKSTAQYTGGEHRVHCDLKDLALGTPYPHLAHLALGFEAVGYRDDDFVAVCVLQSLLGGGGSFSAGGPGKGMFTRLYTDVLNRHHWMYSATAFNHSYVDTGLFCIQASCAPEHIAEMLVVLADQFVQLLEAPEEQELERAKIQLMSQLMMNMEIRPVMFEDLARQVIGHGYRRKPQEYMERISKVTKDDIVRVGQRLLASRPSLVGYGVVDKLQSYETLDDAIAKRDVRLLLPKKKTFSFS